jgi:hypothetical protein
MEKSFELMSHDRGGGGRDLEMLLANQWGRRWPYKKLLAK